MLARPLYVMFLFVLAHKVMAQRQLVVANMESHVPVRDIKIYTDNQQETKSRWDGTFTLRDGYKRITFVHPDYVKRYVLTSELKSDTIFLIPNVNALKEVVIYGHRRFDERMSSMMTPSPQQLERDKLPKFVPQGINPVALIGFLYDVTLRSWQSRDAGRCRPSPGPDQQSASVRQSGRTRRSLRRDSPRHRAA